MRIKQGWQIANSNFIKVFNEVKEEAERLYPDVEIPNEVFISDRMGGQCLGSYNYTRKNISYNKYEFFDDYFLFSSLVYKTNINEVYNICVHEIAHCVADKYYKRTIKHDYQWEYIGNRIGDKFNQKVNIYVSDNETLFLMREKKGPAKYEVYCNHCHRVIKRSRMCSIIKHPILWRCGVCGEPLDKEKKF